MPIAYTPDDDEVAAALAAISCYLRQQDEAQAVQEAETWEWRASAAMIVQGMSPFRLPSRPAWGNVERIYRAGRGTKGIVGL